MNVDTLRHELTERIAYLGYDQMLQLRGYMDSFSQTSFQSSSCPKPEQELPIRRMPGVLKGKVWMSDDFDETPDCFKEYL